MPRSTSATFDPRKNIIVDYFRSSISSRTARQPRISSGLHTPCHHRWHLINDIIDTKAGTAKRESDATYCPCQKRLFVTVAC